MSVFKQGLRKTLSDYLKARYYKSLTKVHPLRFLFFELTHRCNLSCIHCGSDCISDPDTPDLAPAEILKVLNEIRLNHDPHQITIILSGGEPLCYPGIFDLAKKIKALEFPWGLVTNGYGWDCNKVNEAVEANISSITVSLDGMSSSHDWMRGQEGSFTKAVNTISLFINEESITVMDVVTCVNQRNIGELKEIYNLLLNLGVRQWRLFIVSPIGRARYHDELFLKPQQFTSMLDTVCELKSLGQMQVNYSEAGYLGHGYENRARSYNYFCQAGITVAGIMANGDILACPNIDRRFSPGNIKNDSFVDVWENGYKIFRDRAWMKTGICSNCDQFRICKGNGFHFRSYGEFDPKLCHYGLIEESKNK